MYCAAWWNYAIGFVWFVASITALIYFLKNQRPLSFLILVFVTCCLVSSGAPHMQFAYFISYLVVLLADYKYNDSIIRVGNYLIVGLCVLAIAVTPIMSELILEHSMTSRISEISFLRWPVRFLPVLNFFIIFITMFYIDKVQVIITRSRKVYFWSFVSISGILLLFSVRDKVFSSHNVYVVFIYLLLMSLIFMCIIQNYDRRNELIKVFIFISVASWIALVLHAKYKNMFQNTYTINFNDIGNIVLKKI